MLGYWKQKQVEFAHNNPTTLLHNFLYFLQKTMLTTTPESLTARASIALHADRARIWDALTNPDRIREYMFGAETTCDWQLGSPISFKGEWEGKPYEDKGVIMAVEPLRHVQYSYWSNLSGTPDTPENHALVSYTIEDKSDGTHTLTITQSNCPTPEQQEKSEQNWLYLLEQIKTQLEKA